MDKITLNSYAKINIGLNIISKRADGYHNLETIFYPINLFDELTIEKSDEFLFFSNDDLLNVDSSNLIIRAKALLEEYFNNKLNAKIQLKKNIPIGAGLGGGSSNAATTLIGLIKLFDVSLPENELRVLALKLGSDVPFFLNPVPAFAESRGEIITPINVRLNKYLLLINPRIHISTKWAFSKIKPVSPEVSLKSFITNEIIIDDLLPLATNDFEKIVFNQYKEIADIKYYLLQAGANYSMMTGTGSTVWGMFDDEEAAYQSQQYFRCKNYFTFLQPPTLQQIP